MRIICLLFFNVLFTISGFAQYSDHINKDIPRRKTRSVEKLAAALTRDSCSEYEAAKRVYDWITAHIRYDVKRYDRFNWKETTAKQTLRRRKAICSGYSVLFQALCSEAGIKAWVVDGYDKIPDYRNNEPYFFEEHAWNVFKTNGTYHLVDATWGSGGVVRKIKMIVIFNHAFYFYKSKFVRQYTPQFFDADTSWFLRTHIPLVPMWQLKTQALTVERFEKQIFVSDSVSANTVAFESDIRSYDSKTKEDAGLYEGNKGNDFFKRNNRTKAFHTYNYLTDYYKKYDLGNKKCSNNTREKIAGSLADTVAYYGRKFFKDNAVRHKYVLDSITKRDKTISPFSNKLYKEDVSNRKKIKWQLKSVQQQIDYQEQGIKRRHSGFSRLTKDDIEHITSAYSKKHPDTLAKIIAGMKFLYQVNSKKIDSLNVCRQFWNDSAQAKMPVLDSIHASMEEVYASCAEHIADNISLNQRLRPLQLIRTNQHNILTVRRQLRVLQNDYMAVQRYIYAAYFVQHIDPVNRACIRLIKQNKSLVKRIAKISKQNEAEKKLYRSENKKLYHQLKQTTKRSEVKIQIMHKNKEWLYEYKKVLTHEINLLATELNWQRAIHRRSVKLEAKRNKFYFRNMLTAVNMVLQIKKSVR